MTGLADDWASWASHCESRRVSRPEFVACQLVMTVEIHGETVRTMCTHLATGHVQDGAQVLPFRRRSA
ncbi:hypothetical protein [Nocardioides pacificus]